MQPNVLTPRCGPPGSQTAHGAVDPFPSPVQRVGIAHRRLHVPMSEEFLNHADIIAIFQQVRGERVPQRVAIGRLGQPYGSGHLFDGTLPHRFVQMMPPMLTGPRV